MSGGTSHDTAGSGTVIFSWSLGLTEVTWSLFSFQKEGKGLCWVQGGGYKRGHRHPDRPSDFPRSTWQPEPRSAQHRGLCSALESSIFLEDFNPTPQIFASLAVVNGQ